MQTFAEPHLLQAIFFILFQKNVVLARQQRGNSQYVCSGKALPTVMPVVVVFCCLLPAQEDVKQKQTLHWIDVASHTTIIINKAHIYIYTSSALSAYVACNTQVPAIKMPHKKKVKQQKVNFIIPTIIPSYNLK